MVGLIQTSLSPHPQSPIPPQQLLKPQYQHLDISLSAQQPTISSFPFPSRLFTEPTKPHSIADRSLPPYQEGQIHSLQISDYGLWLFAIRNKS